jgi:hypothetical protein
MPDLVKHIGRFLRAGNPGLLSQAPTEAANAPVSRFRRLGRRGVPVADFTLFAEQIGNLSGFVKSDKPMGVADCRICIALAGLDPAIRE